MNQTTVTNPTDYGHILINRDSKELFNLNAFSDFDKVSFNKAKNNNQDLLHLNKDPRFVITELPYFCALQGSLNISDDVLYCGEIDGIIDVIFETKLRDSIEVSKEFENKAKGCLKKYSSVYILLKNNKWEIINRSINENSLNELKQIFLDLNLEINQSEWNLY